ncbi:aspartate aminotransferase family protein [Actinomadura craniellae]|uniref:Aspartate aminotransferase family protein n=1 Tax=Actinomadura craniellae TaxID=2231787 RepID=A0A365HCX7_9ACTN|nr:aspartate aminotransferase family protein [Actinomadura craniellae]RAY16961.1 aspartate aminotransferase family protein [Actinomadura craniellae]
MTTADLAGQTSTGAKLLAAARTVIPGGVNSATRLVGPPYAIATAAGAYVTDADGRRYLDYHAAFGAILLGHAAPEVDDVVRAAIGGLDLVGWGVTEPEVELARLVTETIPSAEQMISAMSGSEAVVQAIRLSRTVTGRPLIVKFQGGFHGWHDAVARNVISAPDRAYGNDPLSRGILPEALDSTLIAEFNDLDSVRALYAAHPDRIAAVIMEPIPHNVGALVPDQEFVEGLRALTAEQGSLLIFDEVITGFRHALGGYQQVCGVMPDLTTFGKAMGNGYPIAGLAGPRHLMEHFSSAGGDVLLAGTFNGNPVSSAAAIATIRYLRDHPDFYQRTHALGDRMRAGLTAACAELGIEGTAAGFGGVFALYFAAAPIRGYRDLMRNADAAYVAFHRRMTDRGFLMLPLALKRNHISAAHTEEDVDRTLEAACDVLRTIRDDGLLSSTG